jgi:hypothetical protein
MLGSWTFIIESINRVFPYIFLLLFSTPFPCLFFLIFQGVIIGFFLWIQSKIDQKLTTGSSYTRLVLQLWFWSLVALLDLEGKEPFLAFWSWDGGFKAFDKNTLRGFLMWTHEKMGGFWKIGVTVKAYWVDYFRDFAGETSMQMSSETTWS